MLKNSRDPNDILQILLSLFSSSATLAGLSLALVGIVNAKILSLKVKSLVDDLFLLSALGFVVVCYFVFFAIRHLQSTRLWHWTKIIDVLFLGALTLLLFADFMTVYILV